MFTAIFATDCPFSAYFQDTPAGRKSFVRTVSRVEQAVAKYNQLHAYDANNPNYIWGGPVRFFEEPNELGIVAVMSFRVGIDPWAPIWPVSIMEYEE